MPAIPQYDELRPQSATNPPATAQQNAGGNSVYFGVRRNHHNQLLAGKSSVMLTQYNHIHNLNTIMPTPIKKPYQTIAGWLTFIVAVLGAVIGLEILPESGTAQQIVGLIISILTAAGYSAARAETKKAASENVDPTPESGS